MGTNLDKPLWVKPQLECRRQMRTWINEAMERNSKILWLGGHDEGTFMWSWFAFYALTGDDNIKKFILPNAG